MVYLHFQTNNINTATKNKKQKERREREEFILLHCWISLCWHSLRRSLWLTPCDAPCWGVRGQAWARLSLFLLHDTSCTVGATCTSVSVASLNHAGRWEMKTKCPRVHHECWEVSLNQSCIQVFFLFMWNIFSDLEPSSTRGGGRSLFHVCVCVWPSETQLISKIDLTSESF